MPRHKTHLHKNGRHPREAACRDNDGAAGGVEKRGLRRLLVIEATLGAPAARLFEA